MDKGRFRPALFFALIAIFPELRTLTLPEKITPNHCYNLVTATPKAIIAKIIKTRSGLGILVPCFTYATSYALPGDMKETKLRV